MLIGIPAVLGPDMLYALRSMGHGDEIAIVDGNYPALEHARRLVRADGVGLIEMVAAILTVMPLDSMVPDAIFRSCENGDPAQFGPIHHEIDGLCRKLAPQMRVVALNSEELYPRVRLAHTVIATTERTLFANVILRKGVILP